jgi:hypothetical protein
MLKACLVLLEQAAKNVMSVSRIKFLIRVCFDTNKLPKIELSQAYVFLFKMNSSGFLNSVKNIDWYHKLAISLMLA